MVVVLKEIVKLLVIVGGTSAVLAFAPPAEFEDALNRLSSLPLLFGFGLAVFLVYKFQIREHAIDHVKALIVMVVISFVLFWGLLYAYDTRYETNTANYQGQRVWIGREPTPRGQKYFADNGGSPEDALLNAGGKAADIWTTASIDAGKRQLRFLFWPVLSAMMFFITATVYGTEALLAPKHNFVIWASLILVAIVAEVGIIYFAIHYFCP